MFKSVYDKYLADNSIIYIFLNRVPPALVDALKEMGINNVSSKEVVVRYNNN